MEPIGTVGIISKPEVRQASELVPESRSRSVQSRQIGDSKTTYPAMPAPSGLATPVEGLRSEEPAEAMVAMRIVLARMLASRAPFGIASQSLSLWCDFDEAGRLIAVRSDVVDSRSALLVLVKQAIEKVITPAALLGRAFTLDLVFESAD